MSREAVSDAFDALLRQFDSARVAAVRLDEERGLTVDEASLSRWRSRNHDQCAPLHVVMALQELAGSTIVSDAMAASVNAPEVHVSPVILSSQMTQAVAKLNASVAAALCPDGPGGAAITPNEARPILSAIDHNRDALSSLRETVRAHAERGRANNAA